MSAQGGRQVVYRQPIITVLGHVDSGKCVCGDAQIRTSLGRVEARELYQLIEEARPLSLSVDVSVLRPVWGRLTAAAAEEARVVAEVEFEDGSLLAVTPEHRFLVIKDPLRGVLEYVRADALSRGSLVLSLREGGCVDVSLPARGGWVRLSELGLGAKVVAGVRLRRGSFRVYDFKVGGYSNFVANGVVVHNTTLLDKIRGTAVQLREAGGITQHIGASFFPKETIESMCGPLLRKYNFQLKVPGLLVIDTPGHEVFANLRRRGGSAADIAILVVDVNKGFQPQTHESMQILISRRVPFLIAANKIDLIPGWKSVPTFSILESMKRQDRLVLAALDERIANIIAALSTYKFDGDRFDRIRDFRRTVAIVPISAKTGEGIQELITVLVGLVQRFMLDRLEVDIAKPGQGVILEVTTEPGFGTVLRAVHVDGVVKKGYYLVAVGPNGPVVSRIRAILMPAPLDEIRDPRKKLRSVDVSYPAAGIIISAPNVGEVYAGSPFFAVPPAEKYDEYVRQAMEEVSAIRIDTDKVGVVIKADTLGSLEALVDYCRRKGVPIRKADVGPVSRKDVIDASVVKMKEDIRGVILAFNVDVHDDAAELAKSRGIPIFRGNILYRVVDDYVAWVAKVVEERRRREFESMILPGKIKVLEGYVFRHSKPAIVGVKVLAGRIRPKYPLIREDGTKVGQIHQIQERGVNLEEATKDMEVAISIREAVVGKHFDEGDVLLVEVPDLHIKKLMSEYRDWLTSEELEVLDELIKIKRKRLLGGS
ncbi:translation initiation factor IF-2 [Candidatus Geothermarchaeota archaeon ex4572_27]|nr:MAG: translation initiation factor IF-2 [Candidatus Geothermarchaeota archaeon ex4572_27]